MAANSNDIVNYHVFLFFFLCGEHPKFIKTTTTTNIVVINVNVNQQASVRKSVDRNGSDSHLPSVGTVNANCNVNGCKTIILATVDSSTYSMENPVL